MDDGRLQISQEGQDGETYERPSIIVFSLENEKLISSARAYVDENEKSNPDLLKRTVNKTFLPVLSVYVISLILISSTTKNLRRHLETHCCRGFTEGK